jgi:hypothetical protein
VSAVVPALVEEGYRFVRIDQIPEYRQYETPVAPPVAVARADKPKQRGASLVAEASVIGGNVMNIAGRKH